MARLLVLLCIGLLRTPACAAEDPPRQAPETKQAALSPGQHVRTLQHGGRKRTYRIHIPAKYDPAQPTPVVLALHGAAMHGAAMIDFTRLTVKADEAGFIALFPSGTGVWPFLVWNAGGLFENVAGDVDDVAFIGALLDDVVGLAHVDESRVYACGLSNGAMMCYRLAAELADRFAAIAPVAGTVALAESHPTRPVPVLHIHGTADTLVPFKPVAPDDAGRKPKLPQLRGVEASIDIWVQLNGCDSQPVREVLSKADESPKVTRFTYGHGKEGAEVVFVVIEDGGHTWPGVPPPVGFLGKTAMNISANDLIWEFFKKHRREG